MSEIEEIVITVSRQMYRFDGCPGAYGIDKVMGERWYEAWCAYGPGSRRILLKTDLHEKALDTITVHASEWQDRMEH